VPQVGDQPKLLHLVG